MARGGMDAPELRGIPQETVTVFQQCVEDAEGVDPAHLLANARTHMETIRSACGDNALLCVDLAEAIHERIEAVLNQWEALPGSARRFCAGMILYFTTDLDDEPDLSSPIGFEDDAELLNACLRMAEMDDLLIDLEGFC